MIQETRKDPRAKVLSMTVRYKSATIDEFIEHHSHDVSRGGMFIKTPSPFPPGTLLKFEVRISEEKKVMQGVGRVVWKRDASGAAPDAPAGMGVKFIKLDEESKAVIDRLVGTRGNKDGAYDVGERQSQPAAEPTAQAIKVPRKGTMIGLGAVSPADSPVRASTPSPEERPSRSPAEEPAAPQQSEGFFPSGAPAEQPPPEDRTVMRQAAELLRDALIEAGGSMEEIGSTGTAPVVAAPNESADSSKHVSAPPAAGAPVEAPKPTEKVETAAVAKQAESNKPPASEKSTAARPSRPPGRVEQRPLPSSVPATAHKGGGKPALMLLGVAAIGGGLFWLTHQTKPAEPPPQPEPAPVVAQPAPEPIATTEPSAVASAEPPASAAPAPSASAPPVEETPAQKAARLKAEAAEKKAAEDAAKKAEADAKKAEAEAKKAEEAAKKKAEADAKKAELDAKKAAAAAAAAAAPKPAPAPKPKAPAAPKPPVETAPSEAPSEPPAEKPPAEAAKPTPAPAEPAPAPKEPPKEAPKPIPAPPESDNPY